MSVRAFWVLGGLAFSGMVGCAGPGGGADGGAPPPPPPDALPADAPDARPVEPPPRDAAPGSDASPEDAEAGDDATAPPDPCAGPQPTRLRVTNHCGEPIWLSHSDNLAAPQGRRLAPGECFDYPVPDAALSATRLWPKTGCAEDGTDCALGQSVAPCPAGGCQPPIESKFEATFADPVSCPAEGADATCVTWYNASQVDGYTLPFLVRPKGPGRDAPGCVPSDCSALELEQCPSAEDLSQGGLYPDYAAVDLRVRDASGAVIGCMSPCKKLNYPAPWGYGLPENEGPATLVCCPTPPVSPEQCSAGPVSDTQYVNRLQTMCPSVYSYAYDDADGLHTCPAQTQFEVVFCPTPPAG